MNKAQFTLHSRLQAEMAGAAQEVAVAVPAPATPSWRKKLKGPQWTLEAARTRAKSKIAEAAHT